MPPLEAVTLAQLQRAPQAVLKVQTLGAYPPPRVCTHEALWKIPPVRIISELPRMSSIQS